MKKTNKEIKHSYYFNYKEERIELFLFGLVTILAGLILSNGYILVLGVIELITFGVKLRKEENKIYIKKAMEEAQKISKAEYDKHFKKGGK